MTMKGTEHNLRSIGALSDIAAEVDGITNYVRVPKRVKWSEELRRERLRLFGGSMSKTSKAGAMEYKSAKSFEILEHVKSARDVWPFIAKLTDYVENKTGEPLTIAFSQKRTASRHYAKAFIVIMRYGFGIKPAVITEQVGTTKRKINSVLNMYRDVLYFNPQFRAVLDELLEQLARF